MTLPKESNLHACGLHHVSVYLIIQKGTDVHCSSLAMCFDISQGLVKDIFKKKVVTLTQSVATGTVHIPTEWDKSSTCKAMIGKWKD